MGPHTSRRRRSRAWATTAATAAAAVVVGAQQCSAQHQAATLDARVRPPAIPASAVPLEALSILRYFTEIERTLLFMSPQEVDQAPLVVQELSECLDSLSMNQQSVSALVTLDRAPAAKGVRQSPLQAVLDVATLSHASWGVDALWALAPTDDGAHHSSSSSGARRRALELSWRDPTPECAQVLDTATHIYRSPEDQGVVGRFWAWEDRPRNLTCMAHTEGEVGMALCTDSTPLPPPPPPPPATTVQRKLKSLLGRGGIKGQSHASGVHNGHNEVPTLVQKGLLMNVGSRPMCHATLQVYDLGDAPGLLHGRRPEVVSEVEYQGFMGAGSAVRYNVPAGGQVKLGGTYAMSLLTDWRACNDEEILAANVSTTHTDDTQQPDAHDPTHAHTHTHGHAGTHTPTHPDAHAPQQTSPVPPATSSTPTTHTRTRPSLLKHGHNHHTPHIVGNDDSDGHVEGGGEEVEGAGRVVHHHDAAGGLSPSAPSPSSSSRPTRAVEGGMPQALPAVRWLEGGDHLPFATLFNEAGESVVLQHGGGVRDSDPHTHTTGHTPDAHTSVVHVGVDPSVLVGEGGGVQAGALLQEVMRALPAQIGGVVGAGVGRGVEGLVMVEGDMGDAGEVVKRAMEQLQAIRSAHQRVVDGIQAQFLTLAFDSHSLGAHAPPALQLMVDDDDDQHVDTGTQAHTDAHAATHTVARTGTHADTHAHTHAHHEPGDGSRAQLAADTQAQAGVCGGIACVGEAESVCVSERDSQRREPRIVRAPARRPEVTRMHTRSGARTHARTHAHAHAYEHRESEAPAAAPTPRAVGRGKAEGQQVDERLRNLQHNPHKRPPRWPGLGARAQDDAPPAQAFTLNQSSQQHEDPSSDGVPTPPQHASRAEKLDGNVVVVKGRRLLVE